MTSSSRRGGVVLPGDPFHRIDEKSKDDIEIHELLLGLGYRVIAHHAVQELLAI